MLTVIFWPLARTVRGALSNTNAHPSVHMLCLSICLSSLCLAWHHAVISFELKVVLSSNSSILLLKCRSLYILYNNGVLETQQICLCQQNVGFSKSTHTKKDPKYFKEFSIVTAVFSQPSFLFHLHIQADTGKQFSLLCLFIHLFVCVSVSVTH